MDSCSKTLASSSSTSILKFESSVSLWRHEVEEGEGEVSTETFIGFDLSLANVELKVIGAPGLGSLLLLPTLQTDNDREPSTSFKLNNWLEVDVKRAKMERMRTEEEEDAGQEKKKGEVDEYVEQDEKVCDRDANA